MNILVYRPAGGLGDVISVLPALAGLRAKYPGARISVVSLDSYEAMLVATGSVDQFIRLRRGPRPPNMEERNLRLTLRRMRVKDDFDLLVNLWCPAGRHEVETKGRVTKSRIECFCEAAGVEPSTPHLPIPTDIIAATAGTFDMLRLKPPVVIVQMHSANPAKNWPHASWQTLATGLRISGCSVLAVRTEGPELAGAANVIGLGILRLAALCASANLVIALDSGLLHMAGAVNTPCVALFGPTDPRVWTPLGRANRRRRSGFIRSRGRSSTAKSRRKPAASARATT